MNDVTILGLGLMGSALARACLKAGHKITVWNRTKEKMKPLVADGALGASSVAAAIDAGQVILICVDSYSVSQRLLNTKDVASRLSNRIIVQLSTGTPQAARDASIWFREHNADYIDGEILVLPEDIGSGKAQILLAGPEPVYDLVEPLLRCLGGDLRYFGENIRAPSTLNLGWLCQRFGMLLGAIHGVKLCNSENVSAGDYASLFPETDRVHILARTIQSGNYAKPNVTVHIWQGILERIRNQAHETGINSDFPEFAAGILNKAVMKGYAEEDVAAVFKLL